MKRKLTAVIMAAILALATFVPVLAAPSDWAADYVQEAIELGIVPSTLQSNFYRTTTRAEFAALAVALYENQRGTITGRESFDDTNSIAVGKAAYIGIVQGVGDNRFNPYGMLTREQAAVLVARLAEALGQPLPAHNPTFADNNQISSWAMEGVGQAQAAAIMGGVGDNRFDPAGSYTREQSIVTMMRLYNLIVYREFDIGITDPPPSGTSDTTPDEPPAAAVFTVQPASSITIPDRRLTVEERQEWIDEYLAMGGATAFELEVIRLVNMERAAHGLNPVALCHTLMLAARFYAQTMANLNTTLGHREGPYGGSFETADAFGDRMVAVRAANGIAGRWTPEDAVQAWMDSPGHRANILNASVTRMGTGFHLGGQWGVFGYQLFGGGEATPQP